MERRIDPKDPKDDEERWNHLGELESGLGGPYVGAGAAVEQPSRILHTQTESLCPADEAIEAEVRHALDVHPGVFARELSVVVTCGKATLRGVVDDDAMRAAAEEVTRGVKGVTSVVNHLRVEHSSFQVRRR